VTATSGGLPGTVGPAVAVDDLVAADDLRVDRPDLGVDDLRVGRPDLGADGRLRVVFGQAVVGPRATRVDITGPARVMTGPNPATNVNPIRGRLAIRFPSRLDFFS
jgi:hypothetical protein